MDEEIKARSKALMSRVLSGEIEQDQIKICITCGELKLISEYYEKGKRTDCKACTSKYGKEYYRSNKEKVARQIRNWRIKDLYGITRFEYDAMLKKQCHRCAICYISEEENGRALAVDHNAKTGQVRMLLCNKCNLVLGYYEDEWHIRRLQYLAQYETEFTYDRHTSTI